MGSRGHVSELPQNQRDQHAHLPTTTCQSLELALKQLFSLSTPIDQMWGEDLAIVLIGVADKTNLSSSVMARSFSRCVP
jgi:hypothetical protein